MAAEPVPGTYDIMEVLRDSGGIASVLRMIGPMLKLVVTNSRFRTQAFAVGRVKDVLICTRRTRGWVGAQMCTGRKPA